MSSTPENVFRPTNAFVEFPEDALERSLVHRFEMQADKYGDRLAIRTRCHELTYDALNAAANRLARAIVDLRGPNPENVALVLEHGAPIIIAILAALKAGKTYVPLDPAYPRERNAFVLEDTQATSLVTNEKNMALAREMAGHARPVLNADAAGPDLPAANLGLPIRPGSLAYILYTSGSTGRPKGAGQTHRNVLCEIMNYTNAAHLCAQDRMLLVSSCSFADAVRTLYGALLNGASLHPYDIRAEGLSSLADLVDEQKITVYRSVATAYRNFLVAAPEGRKFPSVRLVYLAGEPVFKRDVELFRRHFPAESLLVNGLGTSESLTFCWHFIGHATPIEGNNVPVGFPLRHKEVLLLDDARREVSDGEIGEFAVRSRYLTPGYWRRPDLTHERFLPNPEGGDARLYLTGDMGRRMPDGSFLHVGRKDFQIKIRGHRIEAAEVEQALLGLGSLRAALVTAPQNCTGDSRLVAYVVPTPRRHPTVTELRKGLSRTLPDSMVPSAFVFLDALPLSPNGKVDRHALPAPGRARPELEAAYVAPRTPLERELAAIWAEVLDLEKIGVNDSFLELGGDSLLASRVAARVLAAFPVGLPPQALLRSPTIAEMAVALLGRLAENAPGLSADLAGEPDRQA